MYYFEREDIILGIIARMALIDILEGSSLIPSLQEQIDLLRGTLLLMSY